MSMEWIGHLVVHGGLLSAMGQFSMSRCRQICEVCKHVDNIEYSVISRITI